MDGTVNILLSTYNGIRYLDEQIASLLSQTYPEIKIVVRDDGSTDGTYERLLKYAQQHRKIVVIRGERLGAASSFLKLLQDADSDSEFYAFCDQDDSWAQDKIRNAVDAFDSCDTSHPSLYFSRLEYVDSQLNHLGYTKVFRRYGFRNALVENIVSGCTLVINHAARNLLCEQKPTCVLMHDWWCYLVISAFGKIIYDERLNIKYRLHGSNTVGGQTNSWEYVKWLLARYLNPDKSGWRASDQAMEFHKCYADKLSKDKLIILENFLQVKNGIPSRISSIAKMKVWKQSLLETAVLPIRIITGRT
jgi:glycosyltransferase involved in cell wall biosynthesis